MINRYLFLDKDFEPVKEYDSVEIEKLYGIRDVRLYLNTHDKIAGFYVTESDYCEIKLFYQNRKFRYYCSETGTIYRRNIRTHRRTEMKGFINRNELYIKIDGKAMSVSHIVINTFYERLPAGYIVTYMDGNPLNCSLENMDVLTRSEHISSINAQKHRLSARKRRVELFIDDTPVHIFSSIQETRKVLELSKREFYECIFGRGRYDLKYVKEPQCRSEVSVYEGRMIKS